MEGGGSTVTTGGTGTGGGTGSGSGGSAASSSVNVQSISGSSAVSSTTIAPAAAGAGLARSQTTATRFHVPLSTNGASSWIEYSPSGSAVVASIGFTGRAVAGVSGAVVVARWTKRLGVPNCGS